VPTDDPDQQEAGVMFVADISEVVITCLDPGATMLVIELWTAERGLERVERR
jgi:hypothetical protein